MEKKSTKIAYFVALGVFIVLLVILGIQFKGKENPVFVGDGAFYTTGDGVFLDGILKTAADSEGSKYALDGSYYVSPEAGTYFELSEDGNTIVGADGTEYVKSEEKSKDVNGVEYTTYEEKVYSETPFAGTFWSLLPPIVAIVLALITKEVYASLLVGIATGALLYANGNLELALTTLFFNEDGGMVSKLSDSSNVGILVFLVMLGILVALMNKAGGSAAFGRWASTHIHTRAGAQFATLLLGILIFVDDYFNCLTVGSVMRPVTDRQKVSRAKLAYLIDATAAPICIIAPVSSWAAAVTSSVPEGSGINGFTMFLRTIPYNYYAILTMVMSLFLIFSGFDYGPMKKHEDNALLGDLFTTDDRPYGDDVDDGSDARGHVVDLIAPVLVLIAACIFGMVYTGGFFEGVDFITAFANCSASVGLVMGSSIALMFTFVFYRVRGVMTFQDFAACIPEGFKAMVSPMLILSLAWTLSGMTGLLGAKYYVANLLNGSASALQYMLPVIIFLVAVFLAFATGTSWGTFSILIPIVCHAFPEGEMLVISIAACLSGAVCGDHCSPISDTTIMASAGAHCSHVNHVSTQLPYAITAASCAAVCYVITGIAQAFLGANGSLLTSLILLAVAIAVELAVLNVIRLRTKKTKQA